MDSLKLINFMENLRYDRKITQENYLHGVISQRQYYRYRSGESEIPFEVITKFADKLNIPISRLLEKFDDELSNEKQTTLIFFNLVAAHEIDKAYLEYQKMKNHTFISKVNENFFKCSKLLLDFYHNRIYKSDVVSGIYQILDYPKVMKKTAFPDDEIYMLGLLMDFSDKDRKRILKKLYEVVQNQGSLLGGNVTAEFRVYFWMIKNFGRNEQFAEVVDMCERAIKKCNMYFMHYLLEYFHYYKALAHLRLGEQDLFEMHLEQAILNLQHRTNAMKKKFYDQILKDTGIDAIQFAIDRFKKIYEPNTNE